MTPVIITLDIWLQVKNGPESLYINYCSVGMTYPCQVVNLTLSPISEARCVVFPPLKYNNKVNK